MTQEQASKSYSAQHTSYSEREKVIAEKGFIAGIAYKEGRVSEEMLMPAKDVNQLLDEALLIGKETHHEDLLQEAQEHPQPDQIIDEMPPETKPSANKPGPNKGRVLKEEPKKKAHAK